MTATVQTSDLYYDPYDVEHQRATRTRCSAGSATRRRSTTTSQHDFYALSRYDDVERGARRPGDVHLGPRRRSSSSSRPTSRCRRASLIFEDPPIHNIHRSLLSRVFTPAQGGRARAADPRVLRRMPRPAGRRGRLRLRRRPRRADADAGDRHAARHPRGGPGGDPRPRRRATSAPRPGEPMKVAEDDVRRAARCSPSTSTGGPSTRPTTS